MGDWKGEIKNPLIYMVDHESLLCHLKPNNHMPSNGLCVLSSTRWMTKEMTNVLKIYCTFLTIQLRYDLV